MGFLYYLCSVIKSQITMEIQKYLHHKASPMIRDFILTNGILARRGEQWIEANLEVIKENAVFATNSSVESDWFDSTYDDDVWQIDTSKLDNVEWLVDSWFEFVPNNKHIYTISNIPKEAIKLIYKGSGESEF